MKSKIRKLATVVASFALVAAMSVSSFAANPESRDTFNFTKTLNVSNATLASVDGPGLTFSYAVASVTPSASNGGTTITDGTHTSTVKPGVASGLAITNASLSWPVGTAVEASSSGAANAKSNSLTANPSAYQSAGIYRYSVTETVTLDTSATGAEGETLYVDVYVVNGTSGLEISGIVMHDGTTESGAPASKKSFGSESFETVNIQLSKEVTGTMGDKVNQFPFAAAVTDNSRYYYDGKGATAAAGSNKNTTGASSTTLANGESFWLCGLSHEAAASYTETNNTADTYSVTYTGGSASQVAPNGTKVMSSTDVDSISHVTFTNSLDAVSPTGVIMRFGAPLLILVAGIALVLMNRRSRKAADAE